MHPELNLSSLMLIQCQKNQNYGLVPWYFKGLLATLYATFSQERSHEDMFNPFSL